MASPLQIQMMHDALQEKAPQLYRQLKTAQTLAEYVATQADEMDDAIVDGMSQRIGKPEVQNLPYQEKVRRMGQIEREETERAHETYLNEFPGLGVQ